MEIFSLEPPVQRHVPQQAFLLGGVFFRQTLVPHIPLDLGMFLLRRGKGSAQAIHGNFPSSCHIFSGDFSSCLVLGAFLRGETFCRKIRPAVLPAWAEFPRDLNVFSGAFRRTSALPLPGRDTKNLGNLLHSGHVIRGQGVFSFRCRGAIRRIWSASFSMASFFPVPWASLWKFFCSPGRARFPPPVFRCFFLRCLAFRALRQEVRGLWRFFLWSLLCSGMFRNRLFSWGESFSGRHLFRTFLSTWACSCCEGERGVHRPFMGTFLPPAIFFQGTFPPVLSWGHSCGGKLSAGRYGLPYFCLGGVFPGAECVCRNNLPDFGVPLPGRDAKPWKISFTPAMQHGQGVFSFRCRERSGASGQLPFP